MSDSGKGGGNGGPARYTGEVRNPLDELAERMYLLGANDATVQSGVDAHQRGRIDLLHMNDVELAERIAAIETGVVDGAVWVNADAAAIAAADTSAELWTEVYHGTATQEPVIGMSAGRVLAWVGMDAGRAWVAHKAELARATDEGREPRNSLIRPLRLVHGQSNVEG